MPDPQTPEKSIAPEATSPGETTITSTRSTKVDSARKSIWRVRLLYGLGIATVVALGTLAVSRRAPAKRLAPPNTVITADLTLVTSDRSDVACASGQTSDGWRCGYDRDGKAWPSTSDEQTTVQPFMTVDRRLFLVPGLFLEPAIKARYEAEPPQVGRERLKRFTARCKLTVVSGMQTFRLRWAAPDPWSAPEQPTEIAKVSECKIDG